jgi:hypothetical protein
MSDQSGLAESSPFPMIGRWNITGGQNIGKNFCDYTGSILIIDRLDGRNFTGYFDWYLHNEYLGREYFKGIYDSRLKKITFEGYQLSNQNDVYIDSTLYIYLMLSRYEAYLAKNGYDLESGTSRGGTVWEAKFQ